MVPPEREKKVELLLSECDKALPGIHLPDFGNL
jgi:hypothetical protein